MGISVEKIEKMGRILVELRMTTIFRIETPSLALRPLVLGELSACSK